jgi:hypothetical protein
MNSCVNRRRLCSSSEGCTRQQGELYPGISLPIRPLTVLNPSDVARYSNSDALAQLVTDSRDFMGSIAKAKTARLSEPRFLRLRILARISACRCLPSPDLLLYPVRTLIDSFPATEEGRSKQMTVLQDNISWATKENRVFLRQSLEVKLVGLSVYHFVPTS